MSIANEVKKVTTLIDDTILTVETAQRSLTRIEEYPYTSHTTANEAASELERSLKTLRQRRNDVWGYY